jgi:hypothetical protein
MARREAKLSLISVHFILSYSSEPLQVVQFLDAFAAKKDSPKSLALNSDFSPIIIPSIPGRRNHGSSPQEEDGAQSKEERP